MKLVCWFLEDRGDPKKFYHPLEHVDELVGVYTSLTTGILIRAELELPDGNRLILVAPSMS